MSNIYIQEPPSNGKVLLKTSVGDIDIELWSKEAPKACRNFVQLCLEGYYDGTAFHRVVKDFIVQGGDPTDSGDGGESIYGSPFKDEFHQRLRFVRRGLVAMANAGPHDNGSQFFFTMAATPELQNKHTIFGKVVGDTLFNMLKLQDVEVNEVTEKPLEPHRLLSTEVLNNPFDDIVPRQIKRVKKDKEDEKKIKSKSKATKNFSLLSFGDEAEDDEEQVDKATESFRGKSKSSHDLTDDPRLSSIPAVEKENLEEDKRKKKIEGSPEDKTKKADSEDTEPKANTQPAEEEGKKKADVADDVKKVKAEAKEEEKKKKLSDTPDSQEKKKKLSDTPDSQEKKKKLSDTPDSQEKKKSPGMEEGEGQKKVEGEEEGRKTVKEEPKEEARKKKAEPEAAQESRKRKAEDGPKEEQKKRKSKERDEEERRKRKAEGKDEERRKKRKGEDEKKKGEEEKKKGEEEKKKAEDEKKKAEEEKEPVKKKVKTEPPEGASAQPSQEEKTAKEEAAVRVKVKKEKEETTPRAKEMEGRSLLSSLDDGKQHRMEELKKEQRKLQRDIKDFKKRSHDKDKDKVKVKTEEAEEVEEKEEEAEENDLLAMVKKERQKYKMRKKQLSRRENREEATLAMLARFQNKLTAARSLGGDYDDVEEEKNAEEEEEEDADDISWMRHKLRFEDEATKSKVIDANVHEDDRYTLHDPRNPLTQRRRESSKKAMRSKR